MITLVRIHVFLLSSILFSSPGLAGIVLTSDYGSTFRVLNETNGTSAEIPRQFLTPFFSAADFRTPNQLYGLQGFSLYRVDFQFNASSYSFQEVRRLSSGTDALAFAPNGDLYVYNNSGRIGRVDINTGVETLVPLAQVNGNRVFFQAIDFSPTGQLYGVDSNALYQIDAVTGGVTRITPAGVNAIPMSIFTEFDYGENHTLRAITFGETVWKINLSTGLGFDPVVYSGSTFSSLATSAVPEPSSCSLIGSFALLVLTRRLRRRTGRGRTFKGLDSAVNEVGGPGGGEVV